MYHRIATIIECKHMHRLRQWTEHQRLSSSWVLPFFRPNTTDWKPKAKKKHHADKNLQVKPSTLMVASWADALSSSRNNDYSPTNACLNEQPPPFVAIDQSQLVYQFWEAGLWPPVDRGEQHDGLERSLQASMQKLPNYGVKCALKGSHCTICWKGLWRVFNLPTGYGKLLIYQALPLNFDCMLAATGHVVISPLVSLMKDRVERLTNLGIPAVTLSDMQTV